MQNRATLRTYPLTALLLIAFASCGEASDEATDPARELTRITVSVNPSSIQVGQRATATATGYDQNSAVMALGAVTWATADDAVVSITPGGSVTGVALGTSSITATSGGKTATATVAVVPPPAPMHDRVPGFPEGWGGGGAGYSVGLDRIAKRSGATAAYIYGPSVGATAFGTLVQSIRVDTLRGRRVRWSGWVRVIDVTGGAGLWMRIDGANQTLALDNMLLRAPGDGSKYPLC
jgi:hypothetical protein